VARQARGSGRARTFASASAHSPHDSPSLRADIWQEESDGESHNAPQNSEQRQRSQARTTESLALR